jgi:hypothetical protein
VGVVVRRQRRPPTTPARCAFFWRALGRASVRMFCQFLAPACAHEPAVPVCGARTRMPALPTHEHWTRKIPMLSLLRRARARLPRFLPYIPSPGAGRFAAIRGGPPKDGAVAQRVDARAGPCDGRQCRVHCVLFFFAVFVSSSCVKHVGERALDSDVSFIFSSFETTAGGRRRRIHKRPQDGQGRARPIQTAERGPGRRRGRGPHQGDEGVGAGALEWGRNMEKRHWTGQA